MKSNTACLPKAAYNMVLAKRAAGTMWNEFPSCARLHRCFTGGVILITMRLFSPFSIIILLIALVSCERIKKKGDKVANMTKQKLVDKRDAAIDNLIPTFNSDRSDTKYNKKRFAEFFGFAPTADVSDIFCHNDQLGIDSKFQFSFKCNPATKDRIVANLKLSAENLPNNYSSGLWTTFPWWDSSKIVTLMPYSFKVENSYYRYLWFDDSTSTAFYIDFDM